MTITQTSATLYFMINQIHNCTANSVSKWTRSSIPKSLTMRITCVAALALGCAVCCAGSYIIAKNWYQDYRFKSDLAKWAASDEGDLANRAAEEILECHRHKKAKLSLEDLQLSSLPKCLLELTGLQELDLSWNQLKTLPNWMGELKSLTSLKISGNKLKTLPDWIGELKSLTSLDISGNELESLPKWVNELRSKGLEVIA